MIRGSLSRTVSKLSYSRSTLPCGLGAVQSLFSPLPRDMVHPRQGCRAMSSSTGVSAEDIRQLRQTTGAPMMDCKRALQDEQVQGDFDKALEWLRKKGMANADKKSGRTAADGVVGAAISEDKKQAFLAEVNSETDFVAKSPTFQEFVSKLLATALRENLVDIDQLRDKKLEGGDTQGMDCTVQEGIKEAIGKIGENIVLRRLHNVSTPEGIVSKYVHNAMGTDSGKIVGAVALNVPGFNSLQEQAKTELEETARKLSMHVAAAQPSYISSDDVPSEKVEQEKNILREQIKEMNKPAAVIEKIVEGRMKKFYSENCLLQQHFLVGEKDDLTVEQWLDKASEKCGVSNLSIYDMVLFRCGELS
eukprot:gb/GECG01011012.1/.p1 GENE.gb/GECG01011012.1/~~gb/GECG01011012.1/.p1  ORF type:complete len:362 (+),score=63.44 gb/GECG01011012.1/:1-1086(+)